jgi:protein-S-isoprenylcysteine O-methyltransferase Ste14
VLMVYGARMAEVRAKRDTVPGPVRETWTFRLFMLAGIGMVVGGLVEYYFLRRTAVDWLLFALGWACAVGSFAIRRRAIAALGRFWSLHVEIRDTHKFVQTGPFRWMRHPTYFSMILELLCAAFLLQAWGSLAAALVVFIPTMIVRVRTEEEALVAKFGEDYRTYQRTTPAVLPYKFPRHP